MQKYLLLFAMVAFLAAGCNKSSDSSSGTTSDQDTTASEETSANSEETSANQKKTPSSQASLTAMHPDKPNLNYSKAGVALKGYDVVAYQKSETAKKGSAEYSATHEGATFQFSSEKNMKAFQENPEKYIPAAGGYCTFGMFKKGKKVPVDPEAFVVDDGTTYLFYVGPHPKKEGKTLDTKAMWQKMPENKQEKALQKMKKNWEEVSA